MTTMWRVVATLLLLFGLVACGSSNGKESHPPVEVDSVEVNGSGTLGIAVPNQRVRGVIVYFHGGDQKADVILNSDKHRWFFDPLLRAGYAVVAADAGGNAFGNPSSREDYRQLIAAARSKYHVEPTLFVAESMGALAALALLTEARYRGVKGLVGISPMMGIPKQARKVTFIADPWYGSVPDAGDPMSWSPDRFKGRDILLYHAKDDNVIPPGAKAQDFAARFGSVAYIWSVQCQGGHVAWDCYQGKEVAKWLAGLGWFHR